jgi:hypothetical protein
MAVHGFESEQLGQSFAPMLSPGLYHVVLNNLPSLLELILVF